jgi:hypothetical protein
MGASPPLGGDTMSARGHVPSIVNDLALVLHAHGFAEVDTALLVEVVRAHKARLIESYLDDLERLRRRALQAEDLESIRKLLARSEVV